MGHCSQYSAVNRSWIGKSGWDLRHRTGYNANGTGVHGGRHTEHFNATFRNQCDSWITTLDTVSRNNGGRSVSWVGDVGVGVCKSGYHGSARAFDLTKIKFSSGQVDMNWSWRGARKLVHRRRYLAVAAMCRRHFGTVLTCWYNSAHQNHIHFDNGVSVTSIRTGVRSDTTLIQASCNLINGESLAIDGVWGNLTESAYLRLLGRLNMRCYNPKANTSAARRLLRLIARHGFANKAAGAYRANC